MDVTLTAGAISTNLFAKTCKYLAEGVKEKHTQLPFKQLQCGSVLSADLESVSPT